MSEENSINAYFERLAPAYADRYSAKRPFLHWFFRQRMKAATSLASPANQKVLDLGCGTGPLYDFLKEQDIECDYLGADPAPAMLKHSQIPAAQQITLGIEYIHQLEDSYDVIYLLGLTTYLSYDQLHSAILPLQKRLSSNGQLVIHFTHRHSLEYQIRQALRPILRVLAPNKGIWTANFTTRAYTLAEAKNFQTTSLRCVQHQFLPAAIPILHRIFPQWSIRFSQGFGRRFSTLWRSDFLVSYQKIDIG